MMGLDALSLLETNFIPVAGLIFWYSFFLPGLFLYLSLYKIWHSRSRYIKYAACLGFIIYGILNLILISVATLIAGDFDFWKMVREQRSSELVEDDRSSELIGCEITRAESSNDYQYSATLLITNISKTTIFLQKDENFIYTAGSPIPLDVYEWQAKETEIMSLKFHETKWMRVRVKGPPDRYFLVDHLALNTIRKNEVLCGGIIPTKENNSKGME